VAHVSRKALHIFISNRPGAVSPGTSGAVVPGYEARLVDDAGAPVADDEPGHLLVRGDSIATGKIQRVVVREVVARRLGKPGE